jgi:alcohol dehydrogenase
MPAKLTQLSGEHSMLPFFMQQKGYESIQRAMKVAIKTIPFPKPTLFTGPGSSLELCDAIAQLDASKILIVTDKVLLELGLLDNIKDRLTAKGVEFVVFDGVKPDPTFDQIEAGLKILKKNQCQAVLAVGGGSSIDCAKVICARATNNKKISKMSGMPGFKVFTAPLPLFAIPTTAGTGSEVTIAAVVSDPESHKKHAIMDPKLVPIMAALDGSLMTGLPPHITSATGMDALTHAVEAYISTNALPDTDGYALAATRLIMENLSIAVEDGANVEARQNMALASYYAGLAFTKAGVGYVHAIAHNFGAYYHTPHGLANAIVLPYVLDYSKDAVIDRLAKLAEVSGLNTGSESNVALAQKFIDHIREMAASFGIPTVLKDLKKSDIAAITESALKEAHWTYAVPKYMTQATCKGIVGKMLDT